MPYTEQLYSSLLSQPIPLHIQHIPLQINHQVEALQEGIAEVVDVKSQRPRIRQKRSEHIPYPFRTQLNLWHRDHPCFVAIAGTVNKRQCLNQRQIGRKLLMRQPATVQRHRQIGAGVKKEGALVRLALRTEPGFGTEMGLHKTDLHLRIRIHFLW